MTVTQNILEEANKLTGGKGDRTKAYGRADVEARAMTGMIKALFDVDITPEQWYLIMILMKIRRHTNTSQRDNLTDIAGYARVIEILHAEQGEKGYVNR